MFFGAIVVVTIVAAVCLTYNWFVLYRDIDSYLDRAQVAADPGDVLDYLGKVKEGMKKHDATTGHFILIFHTPANDLSLHYKAINKIIQQTEGIKKIPRSKTAYQVGMDNIRGEIRELPNPALGLWFARNWRLFAILAVLWIAVFLVFQ